ncbi:alpha/beta fold hydrolase [Nocardia brasiliensis]
MPDPPTIPGVRRSFVTARGVRFHVTEAGPADGRPVLALHGWPQHHYAYRHLLADPPAGLRIIAPDLPGYGWSDPPPHRWEKEGVAADLLVLLDALKLDRVLLLGHDWGGFVAFRLVLRAPERFDGLLAMNIAHPWNTPRQLLPHVWRFLLYQPVIAAFGMYVHQHTRFLERLVYAKGIHHRDQFTPKVVNAYADRFRARSAPAPPPTPTAPSGCANCPAPPRSAAASPFPSACSSVPTTARSIPISPPPTPPGQTTTPSNWSPTVAISWSRNAPTWCVPACSPWPPRTPDSFRAQYLPMRMWSAT